MVNIHYQQEEVYQFRYPSQNRVVVSRIEIERLYIKKKMSVAQIASFFGYSENKINYWIRKHEIPKRSISDAVYFRNNPNGDPFKIKEVKSINDGLLLGLGLGLYWGEGNKKNKNSIRLGNTDPQLISKFVEFLIGILGVNIGKLRFSLQVFSDTNPTVCLDYWLSYLNKYGINKEQFFKVTVTEARSIGSYREKSQYGVLTVYFSNTKLKKILDSMLPR